VTFEVPRETAIAADRCKRSLHDPTFWQDDEMVKVGSFDDLDPPVAGRGDGFRHSWSLISSIGEYRFNEGKAPPDAAQEIMCAVTVPGLRRGRL
jgi:hypothetical protein